MYHSKQGDICKQAGSRNAFDKTAKKIRRKRDGRRIKHRMPKPVKIRIYQCPYCNGLHFTSMDYYIYKKLLEKERYRQLAENKDNVSPLDAVGTKQEASRKPVNRVGA